MIERTLYPFRFVNQNQAHDKARNHPATPGAVFTIRFGFIVAQDDRAVKLATFPAPVIRRGCGFKFAQSGRQAHAVNLNELSEWP